MAYELQILHASDLEGGVDAIDRAPNFAALVDLLEDQAENSITLSAGDNVIPGPFFNAALFAEDELFNTTINDLLNLEGDQSYSALEGGRGRIDIAVMNTLGFDASTLGNHEFDTGTDTLAGFAFPDLGDSAGIADDEWTGTLFPYLSANLDFSNDGNLSDLASDTVLTPDQQLYGPAESAAGTDGAPRLAPGAIIEENGERIGIVAATTQRLETISSPGSTEETTGGENDVDALAQAIQPVIDDMRAQGVNKIVLSSHLQQIQLEQQLAGRLDGVDVIVAGGSDTLLADETDALRSGDEAGGTYPILTQDASGNPVAIVSTDGEYSYLGRLVVEFDENGVINPDSIDPAVSGNFATTDAVVADLAGEQDPFAEGSKADIVGTLVDGVESVVAEQDGNTFGRTEVFLDGRRESVRTEETNIGNLTADANLAAAQEADESVLVSLKNGGGIRAPIGQVGGSAQDPEFLPPQANPDTDKTAGEVSQLDIVNSLRFNNDLTLITLSPAQLLAVLEHGVAGSGPGRTPGQFPQVGGVEFRYDVTKPEGQRVEEVTLTGTDGGPVTLVADGELTGEGPQAIRVVTLNFIADGGDGYPFADFVDQDPEFANRVDLTGEEDADGDGELDADEDLNQNGQLDGPVDLPEGAATFADAGTEQDALAEYLAANFAEQGFDGAERRPLLDTRIESALFSEVGELYTAFLGRGADPAGLSFWYERASETGDLDGLAAALAASPEATGFYPLLASNDPADAPAFITQAYQQMFGRDPEEAGRAFWADQVAQRLEAGESVAPVVQAIANGAQNEDITTLENRGDIAAAYARALARNDTEADAEEARSLIQNVDNTDASVAAAREQIAQLTSESGGDSGSDAVATQLARYESGVFAEGAAEIVAHDPETQQLFVTNGNSGTLDVLAITDDGGLNLAQQFSPAAFGLAEGVSFNHVEVNEGVAAVAVEAASASANGQVLFFDTQTLEALGTVEVGVLPDNLTFTSDGSRVLTANEGEQVDEDENGTPEADPKGSVSIIDISGGIDSATATTLDFTQFDDQRDQLIADGVRLFPGRAVSDDLEPEYVTVSPDGTQARVALQENNAFAVVDLTTNAITGIQGLGTKDFSQTGSGLDANDDQQINIETLPIRGLYQPDQIASVESGGETYYLTANEGDDRDFDVSEGTQLIADGAVDGEAQAIIEDNGLGALEFSNIDGDTNGDGQIDQPTIFGGRSFAVWNSDGELVFDSGDEFERIMADEIPDGFNSDDEENDFDSESDEAGAEVEGITTGVVDGTLHAFIGLEKPGGVMVYDLSDPTAPEFVDYLTNRNFDVPLQSEDGAPNPAAGDSGPEGLEFIAADNSPTGVALLAVGNEISGTVTLYEFGA